MLTSLCTSRTTDRLRRSASGICDVTHTVCLLTAVAVQRTDGRFLIGETQPTEAANTDTSNSNAARILQLAASAVPALAAASVQGVHVGYRPYPADGYPVLGWVPSCSNAYVAGRLEVSGSTAQLGGDGMQ